MILYDELIKNKIFYKELTNIIRKQCDIDCDCSDCGGNNQISSCQLEQYLKIHLLDKNIEKLYNILDIQTKEKLEYFITYCNNKITRHKNNAQPSSITSIFCQCLLLVCHNGIELNKQKKE